MRVFLLLMVCMVYGVLAFSVIPKDKVWPDATLTEMVNAQYTPSLEKLGIVKFEIWCTNTNDTLEFIHWTKLNKYTKFVKVSKCDDNQLLMRYTQVPGDSVKTISVNRDYNYDIIQNMINQVVEHASELRSSL